MEEGVDPLLPVIAEQCIRLRDQLGRRQEQVQGGLGILEQRNIQVDAQHRQRMTFAVAQYRAEAANLLAIPIELFVRPDVSFADIVAEHVFQRRVVADFPLGQVVGDVVDLLRAQVVQHHFGVGKKQRGDGVGNRVEVIQGRVVQGRVFFGGVHTVELQAASAPHQRGAESVP
ncbi:hypothetical protein D3C71_970050 [compost metagenome]